MRLLRDPVHRPCHALQEERFRLLFAAVTPGGSDQFFRLGYSQRGEEVGEDRLQRATKPNVEEVRQVSIADVVVVGRIGGYDLVGARGLIPGVRL